MSDENFFSEKVSEEQVWNMLYQCYDPEIPLNVVDLGLVYGVAINDNNQVLVKMTLTAPGCPMHAEISGNIRAKIMEIQGVNGVNVEIVWDPPWTQEKISSEGRKVLGMEG